MGGGRVTIHNLKVLRVDPDNHLLIVEGGIPGAPTGYVDRAQGGHGQEDQGRAGREAEEGQEVAAMRSCDRCVEQQTTRRSARSTLSDEVFGGRVNADLIWESVVRAERGGAAGHARDEEPRARQRQRQEAVAAEGHRPRARRVDPQPAVAPRRHRVRAAAAQLRLPAAEEGRARRAARGAGAEAARTASSSSSTRSRRARSRRRRRSRCWSGSA